MTNNHTCWRYKHRLHRLLLLLYRSQIPSKKQKHEYTWGRGKNTGCLYVVKLYSGRLFGNVTAGKIRKYLSWYWKSCSKSKNPRKHSGVFGLSAITPGYLERYTEKKWWKWGFYLVKLIFWWFNFIEGFQRHLCQKKIHPPPDKSLQWKKTHVSCFRTRKLKYIQLAAGTVCDGGMLLLHRQPACCVSAPVCVCVCF